MAHHHAMSALTRLRQAPRALIPLDWPVAAGSRSRLRLPARSVVVRPLSTSSPWQYDLGAKYRAPRHLPAPPPAVHNELPGPPAPKAPRDKAVMVLGVRVPPKPIPPGDEDCCMSGCVHCVLTIYAEDVEEYTVSVQMARDALTKDGVPRAKWPEAVLESEEDGEGGKPAAPAVDPTMAAFMALESKLHKK